MTSTGYARYQQVDVLTMSPARRLVALYGHLLLSLRQARAALDAKDVVARSIGVVKAMDTLNELLFSLDRENGGALAEQLASIYVHLINELVVADRHQDGARLGQVIEIIASLQEAWVTAAQQAE